MRLTTIASCFALTGLLLSFSHARAQSKQAFGNLFVPLDSVRPLARNLFGLGYGFGTSTVSANDDYYLPNDDAKFGSEVAVTYTRFFTQSDQLPNVGLRTGVVLVGRAGNYQFFGPYQGQKVRRGESFLTVPLELVFRRRMSPTSRFYSTVAIGGYFSELMTRTTLTLDYSTGKTQRRTDNWVYATGGLVFDFNLGCQTARHHYRALGLRLSADAFKLPTPEPGALPNLSQGNLSVYYTTTTGF